HFIAHLLHGPLDGALESERVGRAVTLHDDASQSEQSRAVEAARVKPFAERVDRRHDDYASHPGENAAHEFLANEAAHHLHHSLGGSKPDFADEAVTYYDIGLSLVDSVAFDVADVVVCDGFVGNVMLKASEGMVQMVRSFIRQEFMRSVLARMAGVIDE